MEWLVNWPLEKCNQLNLFAGSIWVTMAFQVCDGRSLAVHLFWPIADPLLVGTDGTHFLRGLDGGTPWMFEVSVVGSVLQKFSRKGGNCAIHCALGEANPDTFTHYVHLPSEGAVKRSFLVINWSTNPRIAPHGLVLDPKSQLALSEVSAVCFCKSSITNSQGVPRPLRNRSSVLWQSHLDKTSGFQWFPDMFWTSRCGFHTSPMYRSLAFTPWTNWSLAAPPTFQAELNRDLANEKSFFWRRWSESNGQFLILEYWHLICFSRPIRNRFGSARHFWTFKTTSWIDRRGKRVSGRLRCPVSFFVWLGSSRKTHKVFKGFFFRKKNFESP